jgi:tetratricopeptide (TPR) repeat protein
MIHICKYVKGLCALALLAGTMGAQQAEPKVDKAAAYYHFSMGHLYAEQAAQYGNRGDYLTRAIDHYKEAIKADPTAAFLSEELSDLYIQSGKLREGVAEAEELLRQNPNDLNARRMLGRIYSRMIGDPQQGRVNETMLRNAIEQYQKIAEREPKNADVWLMLGRLHKIGQNSVDSEKAYQKVLEIDPGNEDALTGLAMVYSDLGDTKRATEMLKRVAEKSPSLRTLTNLASTYEQMREYKLAAETLERALEFAPGNSEIKRALAQTLLMSDQYDRALKVYEELSAEDPKDAQSLLRISQIYRQKRNFEKAWEANNRARKIDPDSIEIRYNEVNLLEGEGKMTEAIARLREVVDTVGKRGGGSKPERANRAALLERLGLMYRSEEKFDEAIAAFREMGEVDADFGARAAAQVIDSYRAARNYPKASEEAAAAKTKYPNDRALTAVRATLLAEVGKPEEAATEMKSLLDGKGDREVYLSLAQIYEKAKNFKEMAAAIDAAEKLSESQEEKESVHFTRGAMYERQKKYDLAEAEFRNVLAINPENSSALNYLGYMFADRNVRLPEALDLIQKALEKEPNNGAYLDSLGWVYYRMGKLKEAEDYIRRSLERVSKDPTVRDHLGDILFAQGRFREAALQWEAALKDYESTPAADVDPADVAKIQAKLEGARVRVAKETGNR